jgi:hypothetical protein
MGSFKTCVVHAFYHENGWEAEVRVICDIDVLAFVIDKRGPPRPFSSDFLSPTLIAASPHDPDRVLES